MKTLLMALIACTIISCNSNTPKPGNTDAKSSAAQTEIKVVILPTETAIDDDSDGGGFKYPATIPVDSAGEWYNQFSAYGAAWQTWLAPKNWMGKGEIYGNGGTLIKLYPKGGDNLSGAFVSYFIEPSDQTSILTDAAHYFSDAREEYNSTFGDDDTTIKNPDGIRITQVSATMITYTLPTKNGLVTKGAAFYDDDDDGAYFAEAKFVLPEAQSGLMEHLLQLYIQRYTK